MGVAVRVMTSTNFRICFNFSLWVTPKRCSSSTITSPRSRKTTSFWRSRCVPITMSTFPSPSRLTISFCSRGFLKRLSTSISNGIGLESVPEGLVVLLGQHRRRNQNSNLLPAHHRPVGRPDRHLRLSVAHVAADQTIHRGRLVHVLHDLLDGLRLVRGLLVLKGGLELPIELVQRRKSKSLEDLSFGIEIENLLHHLRKGGLHPLLSLPP